MASEESAAATGRSPPSDLPPGILKILRQAQVPPSALSVLITPLPADGKASPAAAPRLSHHAQSSVNPASVMKLFTTYAGLSLLGPEHTWRNRIYTDGPVRDGVLQGNLIVRGSGDPKLVVERLQDLLKQVHAAGVREVRGDIVLDRSVFEVRERSEPFDDEPLRPYNVGPDGLLLNFKAVIYTFTPDPANGQVQVRFEPPLAGLSVTRNLPLTSSPCSDWRRQLQADFSLPLQVRFAGSYPASCGEREWPVAFPDPAQYAPRVLQALWAAAGGQLSGQVRYGARPAQARLLVDAPSLPLSEVIKDINKFSNNVMAQQVFYTLGQRAQGAQGTPGTPEAARAVLLDWWRERQPHSELPLIDNGSGLSRTQRISARALGELLQRMAASPVADALLASLPVAGVDATMRQRARAVAGQAWLKTGSLRGVSAIAGYAQASGGRRYVVVGVINHDNASAGRAALDALVQWVVQAP